MNPAADARIPVKDEAARELERLQELVAQTRLELLQLSQQVAQAENRLEFGQAAQLLAANEALLLGALRSQADADTATMALHEVARSAELDPLTQLPNRVLLLDRFDKAIAAARRHRTPLALLFIDLNNFKQVNDMLGHGVGDQVLRLVAQALTSAVRDADTVSRHGGDEFLILLTEVAQAADAENVAHKVLAALAAPQRVGDHVLRLHASIGISSYPDDGDDAATLIHRADAAMYGAKRRGPGSFVARADKVLSGAVKPPPLKSLMQPLTAFEQSLLEREASHAQLQEANEQLLLSALEAQELLAAAQYEQRRQADFMGVIAHELRSPLTPIRLASAMLGRVASREPMLPQARKIIDRQTVKLARLVDDLVDVTRIGVGKLVIDLQRVDLVDVIDAAVESSRPAMDTRLQSLEITAPSRALTLHADAMRLAQVFSNLLDNASKYTPDCGAIRCSIAVDGDHVSVTVADNGIGISAAVLPAVFEPFVQDAHAIAFNASGIGVGLTVVRHLVHAHGGSVSAHSAGPGLGCEFVVTLPLLALQPH